MQKKVLHNGSKAFEMISKTLQIEFISEKLGRREVDMFDVKWG